MDPTLVHIITGKTILVLWSVDVDAEHLIDFVNQLKIKAKQVHVDNVERLSMGKLA